MNGGLAAQLLEKQVARRELRSELCWVRWVGCREDGWEMVQPMNNYINGTQLENDETIMFEST